MRLKSVSKVLPLVAFLAMAPSASAQETQLFTWTGRVDREVNLTMQGRNVSSNARRGEEYRGRFAIADGLPQMDGTVRVIVSGGRGEVTVVQQPNASNNYSTVIRMVDRGSGADRYQVTAFFTPANTGRYNRGRGSLNGGNVNGTYDNTMNDDNNGRRMGRRPVVLHWSGMIDANAEVRWDGSRVRQRALDGNALRRVRASITGNVRNPNGRGEVTLTKREGRGDVEITQQPNASNNWTTIIHILDAQGGYGRYAFDVTWQ